MKKLEEFQEKIGYKFQAEGLLRQALTHSSYANEKHMKKHSDNERLEFLGDAVLELVSSDFLYKNYPDISEGELTKKRASIVCEPTLALCTEAIQLGDYLFLGKGEDLTGGRTRKSILSDALEAVSLIQNESCSSVQFSHSVVSDSLRPHELQHARLPCPSPTPGVHSNSCPSSQ